MRTVSITKFLSSINFKQVAYIQANDLENWPGSFPQLCSKPLTILVFVDGTVLLCGQPPDYFRMLAHGRMVEVPFTGENADAGTKRLVPRDAIHHLELVSGQEDGAEFSGEGAGEPAQARIVYRAFDPERTERRFQMPIPGVVIDDLLDRDVDGLVDIGNGRFVFADDIEDARPLKAWQIVRFAHEPPTENLLWEPPVTIIALTGGDFIQSSFHVSTIEGMVGRLLPSAGSAMPSRRPRQHPDGMICV